MTSLERVMNTIQGKPVDRPPVFAVLGIYGAKLLGKDIRKVYNDVDLYVDAQTAVYEKFGFDDVLAPFDLSMIGEAWGGEIEYYFDQPPNLKRAAFSSAPELLTHPLPDPSRDGRLPFFIESMRRLHLRFGADLPVFAVIPGPCILPSLALGLEKWVETLLFEHSCAQDILEYTSGLFLSLVRYLQEAGVTAVIITEGMLAAEVMNREFFARFCVEHVRNVLARSECPLVLHHTGGSVNHVLDLLQGIPSVIGFAVSSHDDLAEARRMVGDALLIGNIDVLQFPLVTSDAVYDRCVATLREAVPQGPFILSTAGPDVPIYTHESSLYAMIDAARSFAEETGR